MRTEKRNAVLGCLTDGKVWHVMKVSRNDKHLSVNDYVTFSSSDDSVIINTIPHLLLVM